MSAADLAGSDVFAIGCPIEVKHPRVFVILICNTVSVIYDVKFPSFFCVMPYGFVDGYRSSGGSILF